ncbi:HET-domain-containing protein [Macroventuria anomochaeta]|uniref:HET-domain-containing protein n=1 Tax=Macroventuria anomochaeta TaxID=301207 RepID=A0ACB6SC04_9PLEO|nr:HET-domain-containing protein [Macroventuria anomochaeta]KAF2630774.1 HET-domain-containing protein [Macroventuria anomochaeta]
MLTRCRDETPAYGALSCVWCSEDDPSHVKASSMHESGLASITENLDVTLRHLRHKRKPRSVWIDVLCINQANNKEKGTQAANMGTVFATANCVISWLGPEENNNNKAIALLQKVAQHLDVDWRTFTMRRHTDETAGRLRLLTRWKLR